KSVRTLARLRFPQPPEGTNVFTPQVTYSARERGRTGCALWRVPPRTIRGSHGRAYRRAAILGPILPPPLIQTWFVLVPCRNSRHGSEKADSEATSFGVGLTRAFATQLGGSLVINRTGRISLDIDSEGPRKSR